MAFPEEIRTFSESVATAIDRTLPEPAPWRPDTHDHDGCNALTEALLRTDWPSVAEDPELLGFCGPAGIELGKRLAPLRELDLLLGGSPVVDELVRYAAPGLQAVTFNPDGLVRAPIIQSQARAYSDAIGVHRVLELGEAQLLDQADSDTRINAWVAANVGYCAGVGVRALETALEYALNRRAFGSTLAALAPVQQMLADAATTVRGLGFLASEEPGQAALAHAGPALCSVTAICQQLVGGIGFTLEFPLQRAYRRARMLMLWNNAVLDDLDCHAVPASQ